MTFESFYGSFTQQPVLLWCAAASGLVVVVARRGVAPRVRAFCIGFGLLPFVDAWLTADDVAGVGALGSGVSVALGSLFAILGDLRAFLFLEGATDAGDLSLDRPEVGRALRWSLVVPVITAAVHAALPPEPWLPRATFLFYEAAFLAVWSVRLRRVRGRLPAWGRPVAAYVAGYYVLWASADVVILAFRADAGFLVRTVANVLYYGGLLAVVSVAAPAVAARASPTSLQPGGPRGREARP